MAPRHAHFPVVALCLFLFLQCGNKSPTGTTGLSPALSLVAISRTISSITLSWNESSSPDFKAYKLYRSDSAGVTKLSLPVVTITNRLITTYTDTGLDAGAVYYYRLYNFEAYNAGVSSNEINDTTPRLVLVQPDTVVLAVSYKTMTSITLSWTQCREADFAAYKIFRADTAGITEFSTPVATLTSRMTTSFTDTGLSAGTVRHYRVYLYRGLYAGIGSNEIKDSTLLTEPPLPRDTIALAVTNRTKSTITISWTPCTAINFAAYKVFRSDSAGVTEFSTPMAMITNRLSSSFTDTGLDAGAIKHYRVYLYRGLNRGTGSNEVKDSTLTQDPASTDSITLAVTGRTRTAITLSWTQCNANDFSAYKIYRSDTAGVSGFSTPVAIITSRAITSYADTGMSAGTVRYYRVYQFRGLKDGTASNEVKDSTLTLNAYIPDTLELSGSGRTNTSITLSWTQSSSTAFTAYKLFRSTTATVNELSTPIAIITSRISTAYTDNGLVAGTTYYYRVYNFEEVNPGAPSNIVQDSTLRQSPAVADTLVLAATGRTRNSITLSWTQSTNGDFTAYKIFRSTAAGVTDLKTQVAAITDRITTTFRDTGLTPGSVYFYRVFNFAGTSAGAPSNEVKDSTAPVIPDTIVLTVSNRTKTSITLSWTQCADSSFAAYKLFKSDSAGVTDFSVPVTIINNRTTTSYTETGLDSGIVQYYRVYQFKGLSAGVASNEATAVTLSPLKNGMIYIGPGTFRMGSTNGETNEMPVHQVTLTEGFWLDRTEVTQADYTVLMGVNPSILNSVSGGPVEKVTWFDAVLYCNKRSQRDGLDTVYSYSSVTGTPGANCTALGGLIINLAKNGYRLPTEAQWEFACRAGATSEYYWGSDSIDGYAWYSFNGNNQTHAVAIKMPNAHGLYDMSGNVWEWCNDWFGDYRGYAQNDPPGASTGTIRILRGGSWSGVANVMRSAFRLLGNPYDSDGTIGFRVVRPVQ